MTRDHRETIIQAFLNAAGWDGAQRHALAQDASSRHYERLTGPLGHAILMDSPPDIQTKTCPPNASAAERAALGIFAISRLAGPDTRAFTALAGELVARGFSAPKILAADHAHGLLLLEDLGDALFSRNPANQSTLYSAAVDTLSALCRCSFEARIPPHRPDWTILDYDPYALQSEADLLLDWYAPYRQCILDDAIRHQVHALWADAFAELDALPKVLTLRDVHAENLLWLPDREGVARTGLLDFQDAVFGSPAYDLVSLLQDSRRVLPEGLEETMLTRFLEGSKIRDHGAFMASYALLGAQRSAKVLGIFVRLAQRDDKPKYLDYLPIAARNMVRSLDHPLLSKLKQWMHTHMPAIFIEGAL